MEKLMQFSTAQYCLGRKNVRPALHFI